MSELNGIVAIILAGGNGRRIGGAKALHPLGDSTFIESILSNLSSAGLFEHIIVVSNELHDRVLAITNEAKIVVNSQPNADMWSSLQAGIHDASDVAGCMVIPVDYPFVQVETYHQLADAFRLNPRCITIPQYKGHGGHPVVLPFSWAKFIPDLQVDGGLRLAIKQSGLPIHRLSVNDPGVLRNINEIADLNN